MTLSDHRRSWSCISIRSLYYVIKCIKKLCTDWLRLAHIGTAWLSWKTRNSYWNLVQAILESQYQIFVICHKRQQKAVHSLAKLGTLGSAWHSFCCCKSASCEWPALPLEMQILTDICKNQLKTLIIHLTNLRLICNCFSVLRFFYNDLPIAHWPGSRKMKSIIWSNIPFHNAKCSHIC